MGWDNRGHSHTEYPDATGQASGKVAETDGANGWTFIDTPSGSGGGASELPRWSQDDVAASQTDVALTLLDATRETVRVLADGTLTAVLLETTEARTGGTCTVTVQVNGVDAALTATLDASNTEWHKGTGTVSVSAGDEVGVVVTTDGTWAPTTAEILVGVQVGTDDASHLFEFSSANSSYTTTSTSLTDLDTATDITINAATGDRLSIDLAALWNNQNEVGLIDVATVVSGSANRYASSGTSTPDTEGIRGWQGHASDRHSIGGSIVYTVNADDVVSGQVTLRLRWKSFGGATKGLLMDPGWWSVRNWRQ